MSDSSGEIYVFSCFTSPTSSKVILLKVLAREKKKEKKKKTLRKKKYKKRLFGWIHKEYRSKIIPSKP